jgi:hypothetical protein
MNPILPVFYDGVTGAPNAERFTIWRNALRWVHSMCAIQEIHPNPQESERRSEERQSKDQIWLYSEDIDRFGTECDKMDQLDCETPCDGNRWMDLV